MEPILRLRSEPVVNNTLALRLRSEPIVNNTLAQYIDNIPKSSVLYTLPAFDDLFENVPADRIKREFDKQVNNVIEIDWNTLDDGDDDDDDDDGDEYEYEYSELAHCHVVGMLNLFTETVSLSAISMALGIQHLNTGDSSLVSNWGELRQSTCNNMAFTLEYSDTKDSAEVAVNEIVQLTERKVEKQGYKTPCSFVTASRSSITIPTTLMTNNRGYMVVASVSTTTQLDSTSQYPFFARVIPNDADNVLPIMDYFVKKLNLKYLAVIHVNEAYGNSFGEAMVKLRDHFEDAPFIRRFVIDSSGDTIGSTLKKLKDSQLTYVLAVMPNRDFYDKLMTAAFEEKMAGSTEVPYQWYFSDSFRIRRSSQKTSKVLSQAYNGTGAFSPSAEGIQNNTRYKDFISQMNNLIENPEDEKYIHDMVQKHANIEKPFDLLGEGIEEKSDKPVLDQMIFDVAALVYDATIAMGWSACLASGNKSGFTSAEQFNVLSGITTLDGVTGMVKFDNETGSRTINSTYYKLVNYVADEMVDEKTGKTEFVFNQTITNSYYNGSWIAGEQPFVYGNGLQAKPKQLAPSAKNDDKKYRRMRILALFLSALSICSAIGFAIWTWCNRSTRVIQASQPFFLYFVSFGVTMVATSIVPYTVVEITGHLPEANDDLELYHKACTSIVWFFFPGVSLVFSALYTKTYRINLIMKHSKTFRKVKVTKRETLKMMGVMLSLNFAILAVMTALKPPKYETKNLGVEDAFDRIETIGLCVWKDQRAYLASLISLNMLIAALSAFQSWEARELSTEFAESQYIFTALLITIILGLVTLPVLSLSRDNPATRVFIYGAGVFMFCMNILLLIFVPKIRFLYQKKKNGRTSVVHVGRIAGISSSRASQGELIVTTQSAKTLAARVTELEKLLREKEEELLACRCNELRDTSIIDP